MCTHAYPHHNLPKSHCVAFLGLTGARIGYRALTKRVRISLATRLQVLERDLAGLIVIEEPEGLEDLVLPGSERQNSKQYLQTTDHRAPKSVHYLQGMRIKPHSPPSMPGGGSRFRILCVIIFRNLRHADSPGFELPPRPHKWLGTNRVWPSSSS